MITVVVLLSFFFLLLVKCIFVYSFALCVFGYAKLFLRLSSARRDDRLDVFQQQHTNEHFFADRLRVSVCVRYMHIAQFIFSIQIRIWCSLKLIIQMLQIDFGSRPGTLIWYIFHFLYVVQHSKFINIHTVFQLISVYECLYRHIQCTARTFQFGIDLRTIDGARHSLINACNAYYLIWIFSLLLEYIWFHWVFSEFWRLNSNLEKNNH